MELVDDESKIVIDIAICTGGGTEGFEVAKNAANNYFRAQQLRRSANGMNAINWQKEAFPDAQYRYLFYMEDPVDTIGLLDFRNQTTWPLQEQGRK